MLNDVVMATAAALLITAFLINFLSLVKFPSVRQIKLHQWRKAQIALCGKLV